MEDYKEKYEQALNRAKIINPGTADYEVATRIFPELKESEEEDIRKSIIGFLKTIASLKDGKTVSNEDFDSVALLEWAAWLERQDESKPIISEDAIREGVAHFGITQYQITNWLKKYIDVKKQSEQKTADKVEPKFKVGDWVIYECGEDSATLQIKNIVDGIYEFTDNSILNVVDENTLRLWSIKDAKEGDVLTWDDSKCIALFKEIYDKHSFKSHGCIGACTEVFQNWGFHDIENAHPANKEQRGLLFRKMKEAGYEWDAEKKELKKIEQKNIEGTFINVDEVRENFVKEVYRVLANDTTNDRANDIIYYFDSLPTIYLHTNKPLPSDGDDFDMDDILKNHDWSEKDEEHLNSVFERLEGMCKKGATFTQTRFAVSEDEDWLKSLKQRMKGE